MSGFTAEEDGTGGFVAAEEAEEGLAAGKESSSFEAVEETRDTSLMGAGYSSVKALNAAIASSNGTKTNPTVFTIAGNIDVTEAIVINPGKHVKLTGGTLRRGAAFIQKDDHIIQVTGDQTNRSSLVLEDITVDGMNRELAGNNGYLTTLVYVKGADFTMKAGTVLKNNKSTALCVGNAEKTSAKAVMEGGTITKNSSVSYCGGVRLSRNDNSENNNGVTFEMRGGTISNNTVSNGDAGGIGAGIMRQDFQVIIRGGEISGNTATNGDGGGIYCLGPLDISGGKISGNTATNGNGGGVYKGRGGPFTMTGGEISSNTATGSGANVYDNTYSYKFTMSGDANIPDGLAVDSRSSDYISLPEALKNPVKIDKHADDGSGSYVAVGDNYTLTEADLGKFAYPDNTCVFRLDKKNNRIVLAYPSIDVTYELKGIEETNLPDSAETKVGFQIKLFLSEGYALPDSDSVAVTSGMDGTPVEGVTWTELPATDPSGGLLTIPEVPTDGPLKITVKAKKMDAALKTLGYTYEDASGSVTEDISLAAGTYKYDVTLPKDMASNVISLTSATNDENATVSADSKVTLDQYGKATAVIEVTAEDSKTKQTYTVNFKKPLQHKVTVEGSHAATETGAGFYYEKDEVTVNAGNRSDYAFAGWTTTSAQVSFTDADQAETTFTMPDEPVTVTATWLSTDATLKTLGYSYVGAQGSVTEANILKDDTYIYNVELPGDIASETIALTPEKKDQNAKVEADDSVTLDGDGKATANITVTAQDGKTKKTYTINFIKPYKVTVEDSHSEKTGEGFYYEGKTVTVNAGSRDGYVFDKWTTLDNVTFTDADQAETTFKMPAKPVTVTATWLSTDATLKTLGYSYVGAQGSVTEANILKDDTYIYNVKLPGDIASETIDLTPEKKDQNAKVEANDSVTLNEDGKATAVITVTAEDGKTKTTYTVNFIKPHEVTVADSYTKEETGAGLYYEGDEVTIKAGSRGSHVFSKWTSSSEEVTFEDETKAETTFTMPSEAVTVTAHWIYISQPEPEPPIVDRPTKENPDQPTTAETKAIEAGADGQASLNPDDVERALRAAQQDAAEKGAASGTAVVVPVQFSEASAEMGITIPAQVLDELVSQEAEYLKLQTNGFVSFSLPKQSLAGLSRMDGDGGIVIQTKEAGGLDKNVQKAIGDRPVLDAAVYRIENGSRIPIEKLEDCSFTMRLSYQPAAGEDPAGLYGVSVDEAGALHWLEAAYEEMNGAVALELTKSGIYGVGYLNLAATKVSFSGRTTTQVTIAWQPVEAAEGYTIWYRPEGQTESIRKIIPSADRLSWDCRNLQPGTKHFYTVRPWVKTAGGYVFGPASKVLRGTTKPLAARILKVSMENGKIKTVLQGPAVGADRYAFCYSKTPDFDPFGVGIRTSYTTRSFPVNNTKTGYYVRVRSYRDLGSGKYVYGDWSNQVRVD